MVARRASKPIEKVGRLFPGHYCRRKPDGGQRSEIRGQRFLQCLSSSRDALEGRCVRSRIRDSVSLSCLDTESRMRDRKSTRLNSSHVAISYAVFCLKKKKKRRMKYIS